MNLTLVQPTDQLGDFSKMRGIADKYSTTLNFGLEKTIPNDELWEALYIDLSTMGYNPYAKSNVDKAIHERALTNVLMLVLEIGNTRRIDEMHIVPLNDKRFYLRCWAD